MPTTQTPIINPDADRRLARIAIRYGLLVFALLVLTTFGLSYANAQVQPKTLKDLLTPRLAALNLLSIMIVLLPFYAGIQKLFAARLEIGRERVQARAWREAIAALDPFTLPVQRFLDSQGEAHFLLAQAYAALGDKARAEKSRAFVRRKPGSPWAAKMPAVKGERPKLSGGKGASVYPAPDTDARPRPAKSKPRRRF